MAPSPCPVISKRRVRSEGQPRVSQPGPRSLSVLGSSQEHFVKCRCINLQMFLLSKLDSSIALKYCHLARCNRRLWSTSPPSATPPALTPPESPSIDPRPACRRQPGACTQSNPSLLLLPERPLGSLFSTFSLSPLPCLPLPFSQHSPPAFPSSLQSLPPPVCTVAAASNAARCTNSFSLTDSLRSLLNISSRRKGSFFLSLSRAHNASLRI